MSEKLFLIEWPDHLGSEWLNEGGLCRLIYTEQMLPDTIYVKVIDVTDIPDEIDELNGIVIGALSEFVEYMHRQTGHRRVMLSKLVDDFINWKGIKHTGGEYEWAQQCSSNIPDVPGVVKKDANVK